MPVSRVEGLDVPISAQIMARRWHDPRLLAWGMAWQQQHPEFVRVVPKGPTAAARFENKKAIEDLACHLVREAPLLA